MPRRTAAVSLRRRWSVPGPAASSVVRSPHPTALVGMEFRLLGPLEVAHDGRLLALGGRRQRAVLAILLLNADEAVARERLAAELWDGRQPESAMHTIEVYVS